MMNTLTRCIRGALATGACLCLLAPAAVLAQDEASGDLMEEILVTAQRRAESLQDVPVAVTAFNDEQLARLQVVETLDITRLVPNLIGANNTGLGTANTYSLRGLNNTESIATFDPPVGSYIDDVYVSRQNANNFAMFDIERIEVLRGPQGTLFGRNTTGGAVNVILKKPAEEMGGFLEAGYGEFDRLSIRGSIDIPVNDRFLTKLSAYYIEDDGFVDNVTTGEDGINSDENFGVRGAFRWLIDEDITWDLAIDYVDQDHAGLLNFDIPGDGNSDRITATGLGRLTGLVSGEKQNFDLGNRVESWSLTSNFQVGTPWGELSFITGYRNLDQQFNLDFFNGPFPTGVFTIANDGEHNQFTQEIKLSGSMMDDKLDFVTGIFYINEENQTDFADIFTIDIGIPSGLPLVLIDRDLENNAEAFAVFTQFDYHVNEQLTLTAGIRWTDEEKDVSYLPNQNPFALNRFDTGDIEATGTPTSQSERIWTPRVALEFQATDDVMLYASATRGFKSGGWNARGTNAEEIQPFFAEKVWSYEAGLRSDWLDGTLRMNLTAFIADVSDFQLPSAFVRADGSIAFITRNFADLENKGLEAEFIYAPTDGLTLFANLGFQDAEYKNLDPSITAQQQRCQAGSVADCGLGIVDPQGDIADPVRAPDFTASIGATYVFNINDDFQLIPTVNFSHAKEHNVGTSGLDVGIDGTERNLLSAGLTLNAVNQNWRVTLECQNCTDDVYTTSVLVFPYIDDPMTWDLRFRYDF